MKIKYLLILLVLFLVGCGSIKVNKEKFVQKIDTKFDNMLEISKQELTSYYGLNLVEFKDYTFKVSLDTPVNVYVLVLPESKKNAKKEIEKFFKKLETNYDEGNQKRIKNKYYNTYGDYLFYIVSDNNKDIYKEMSEFIKSENKND